MITVELQKEDLEFVWNVLDARAEELKIRVLSGQRGAVPLEGKFRRIADEFKRVLDGEKEAA